jgi:glucarate dehydratase
VDLDYDKLRQYAELFQRLGGYAYDRDPQRPEWYAVIPETRFAVPRGGKSATKAK